ncbi:MAG TPA: 23S rRNA (adenine(2030)-N(6))-methyltransferase RlmJ [Burkholderiales bacterium]
MHAYRHLFHAGNFADVFKHALLTRLAIALTRKDKPFCYLDTHAGLGRYDLKHPWAQKNREFKNGLARVWQRDDVPELLVPWLEAVRAVNPGGVLREYPGSPVFVQRLLRPDDRMVLCELNTKDHATLKSNMAGDARASAHHLDGFTAVRAHLPPRERRGLVLMDPAFDQPGEFKRVLAALVEAHQRFATGVLAFWYPMMEPVAMHRFEEDVAACGVPRILQLELTVHAHGASGGLRGCGLLVVNPPFGFEAEAREIAKWLAPILAEGRGGKQRIRWLTGEKIAREPVDEDEPDDSPAAPKPAPQHVRWDPAKRPAARRAAAAARAAAKAPKRGAARKRGQTPFRADAPGDARASPSKRGQTPFRKGEPAKGAKRGLTPFRAPSRKPVK